MEDNRSFYTGAGDPNLDLEDQRSFAQEGKIRRDFTAALENLSGEDKVIAIMPAYLRREKLVIENETVTLEDGTSTGDVVKSAKIDRSDASMLVSAGFADVDVVADDGVIFTNGTGDLTASSPDGSIAAMQDFMKHSPTRVTSMKITVNDKDVYPADMKIAKLYPGQNVAVEKLPIRKYLNSGTNLSTVLETADEFQLDANTVLYFKLPGTQNGQSNVNMEITFNLGATHSLAHGLKEKAQLAQDNIMDYGE